MALRLVIADDHRIIRIGLRSVLEGDAGFEVVGEAETAQAALLLISQEKPDIAILDVGLPDDTGISILPSVHKVSPNTRVLILTAHVEPEIAKRSLSAGIHGYMNKASDPSEVVQAVRMLSAGRSFFSVPLEGQNLGEFLRSEGTATPQGATRSDSARPMSQREREVLTLFAQGLTHRQIAERLGVRTKTIETYRSRLGDRFGVRSREELARCAVDLGLVNAGLTAP